MKMRNIVPRVGIEPTSLAFQANLLTISPPRIPDVTTLPVATCLCSCLPERSVQITTLVTMELSRLMLTITYTQAMTLYGKFNNHTAHNLYRIMAMATSVVGLMKM